MSDRPEDGLHLMELWVPSVAARDMRELAGRLQVRFQKAAAAERQIGSALATINAPRPEPITAERLVLCLVMGTPGGGPAGGGPAGGGTPDSRWRPHIEAFFDELSEEAIHDIVLAGVVSFEDLHCAARTWRMTDGRNVAWIDEMADLELARPAP